MKVKELIKKLEGGEKIILSTVVNQYGDEVIERTLEINEDGLFEVWQIECYDSNYFGMGCCHCNSHDAASRYTISPESALEYIAEYIERQEVEEEKKEKERLFIAKMIEFCNE
jgi:hypothetical protein